MVDQLASGGTHVDSIVDLRDDKRMTAAGECKRKNEDRPLQVKKIQGLNHHIEVTPGQSDTQNNTASNYMAATEDRDTCNNSSDDSHAKTSSGTSSQMNTSTHGQQLGTGEMKTAPITVLHSTTKPYHILYDVLSTRGIPFIPKNTARGTTYVFTSIRVYNTALNIIKQGNYEYFVTRPTTAWPTKIVVKDIPAGTDPDRVGNDLSCHGIPAIIVHQMYAKYREPLDMFHPDIPAECEKTKTFTAVIGLPVQTADYKYPTGPLLCGNCNRFGHTTAHYQAAPACRFCSGPHKTTSCKSDERRCINCKQQRCANYKGCPLFVREINQRFPQTRKTIQTTQPTEPQRPTARQHPLIQQHQKPPPSRQPEQAEWQTVKSRKSNYWQQHGGVHYQQQP
ncbi:hypothetical protein PR048_009500 [Dryococelus australis]|uniref:Uncharacterized protein n=1 Tax=Dryococelus australis TaxID=614101 RepID=A0ABQ9I047_9NEOP|nr:hypothetical protein PR048_009500 [Dryococelus australis]